MSKLDAAEDLEREVLWLLDSLLDQVTTEQERENLFASFKLPLATTRAAASCSDHSNGTLALILEN